MNFIYRIGICLCCMTSSLFVMAQKQDVVKMVKDSLHRKVDIYIGKKLFTSFLYPDTLEKPVLYPVYASDGAVVTRGFPLNPQPGDPTDHPHHIGIWFNYENVNGLDFWNNSYAIPKEKKSQYGWIKTTQVNTGMSDKGILSYRANWTNQQNEVLLEETTYYEFSGSGHERVITRTTILKANTDVTFNDAKDGLLGIRVAHALQIPTDQDQKFTDNKGIVTVVKGGTDKVANGDYITSNGKQGNDAWSTRGIWCKMFGKIGNDSVSIAIIDHPKNPNYPTFWHARGYGLFAANPLGEKVFTNGKSTKNLQLKKGEDVTFRYRIIVADGNNALPAEKLNREADAFGGYGGAPRRYYGF